MFLEFYLVKSLTSNCQAKVDSVKKTTKLWTFYHDRLPIFQYSKMCKLQHQSNNIVETTQLTNDQMPEFHCKCECLKCSPPAPSCNASFSRLL